VTKLILDKEGKFLLASALSAIFKVNQNKKKPVFQMFPSTHLPSFIQISPAVSEKQVHDARTHGRTAARTRVKIISCHSFAWQLNNNNIIKRCCQWNLSAGDHTQSHSHEIIHNSILSNCLLFSEKYGYLFFANIKGLSNGKLG
jgi:hypothetical protein